MYGIITVRMYGTQVLWGDIGAAIHTHDMLYHVTQRHNFLPEVYLAGRNRVAELADMNEPSVLQNISH
jgi:hypothetical protein